MILTVSLNGQLLVDGQTINVAPGSTQVFHLNLLNDVGPNETLGVLATDPVSLSGSQFLAVEAPFNIGESFAADAVFRFDQPMQIMFRGEAFIAGICVMSGGVPCAVPPDLIQAITVNVVPTAGEPPPPVQQPFNWWPVVLITGALAAVGLSEKGKYR